MTDARDDDSSWDYDSGPFCRHWSDPSECDKVCATCGHRCIDHRLPADDSRCTVDGCDCPAWVESK